MGVPRSALPVPVWPRRPTRLAGRAAASASTPAGGRTAVLASGGEGGERVAAQQQGAGLGVVDIEDFDVHLHVRVEVAAQVAVEQFEAAVGRLIDEQASGEADFGVEGMQRGTSG